MIDECPTAIIAFEAVAAREGTIARVRIEARYFDCRDIWPSPSSPPACIGGLVPPGIAMHGWASFEGTDKVAAITLARSLIGQLPSASFGPWQGWVEAFYVPPPGWVMP